jgi:hypothetical protein
VIHPVHLAALFSVSPWTSNWRFDSLTIVWAGRVVSIQCSSTGCYRIIWFGAKSNVFSMMCIAAAYSWHWLIRSICCSECKTRDWYGYRYSISRSFAFTATNATNQPMSAVSSNAHHGKYIRLSPKPYNAVTPGTGTLNRNNPSSPNNSQTVKSPIRRPRGDAKKCRKVYGMDHRDLWRTPCKWKKARTRFGESN